MIRGGQVVLFRFPQTDLGAGKLRPALVLCQLPGAYDDWLICMISSQLQHQIKEFDEIVKVEDADFKKTGLKNASLIRLSRLAVAEKAVIIGEIGKISASRLARIKAALSNWIGNS